MNKILWIICFIVWTIAFIGWIVAVRKAIKAKKEISKSYLIVMFIRSTGMILTKIF